MKMKLQRHLLVKMREEGITFERFEKNVLHYAQLISIFACYIK